jgi:RNA recognition motif-containing protein
MKKWYQLIFAVLELLQITDLIKPYGAVEDVRLIRDKVTGESRGFAFVDFSSVLETQQFMSYTKGLISIDGVTVHIDWGRQLPNAPPPKPYYQPQVPTEYKDWICPQVF